MAKKRKRSKRIKPIYDNMEFDSQLELEHYKILKEHRKVKNIKRQMTFPLKAAFSYTRFPDYKQCRFSSMVYTPDFIVEIEGVDKPVAIESKGYARGEYRMRKKLFIMMYKDDYYFLESRSKKHLIEVLEGLDE